MNNKTNYLLRMAATRL